MKKEKILSELQFNYAAFIQCIESLSKDEFGFAMEGKWNAGQTLNHLHRAVAALSNGLLLPKFLLALILGKSNRDSKDYAGLVTKYKGKLDAGGKASGRYLPRIISFADRQKGVAALKKSVDSICRSLGKYSEEDLDHYILPHPLLGKLTIREMMYFTIYHAEHHHRIVLRDLNK